MTQSILFSLRGRMPTAIATPNIHHVVLGFALVILCSFPSMASRYLPLGSSLKPVWITLSILVPLLTLVLWGRRQSGLLVRETGWWVLPWFPLLLAYCAATIWHQHLYGLISVQLSRIIFAAVVYAAARLLGLRWEHLRGAGWVACGVYGMFSVIEWLTVIGTPLPELTVPVLLNHFSNYRVGLGANPITFGSQAIWMTGLVITIQLHCHQQSPQRHTWAILFALMGLLAGFLTLSRGPLLGMLTLALLCLIFLRPRYRIVALAVGLAIGMSCLLALFMATPDNRIFALVKDVPLFVHHGEVYDSSISQRLQMWRLVAESIPRWPWFGPGASGVAQLAQLLDSPTNAVSTIEMHGHFHSDLLQSFALGGLVLICGHVATLGILINRGWRNPVLLWLVMALITFGLTDRVLHENNLFTFFTIAWALYCAAFDNQVSFRERPVPNTSTR